MFTSGSEQRAAIFHDNSSRRKSIGQCVRCAPPAVETNYRELRPLRLLLARLPYLCPLERRNGFSARAHLPDETRQRRRRDHKPAVGQPFRLLPRLYGLHDRLPLRSRLRKIYRSNARANRTPSSALARRKTSSPISVRGLHAPGSPAL